ncbi:hypothetical protein GALMADRAFT_406137 [Galerina marginata CBS 339.88]|uniref:Uncharacterized protein n=1 Tax=Galerina marginata (strain CBS 339.88) TaxID=685588 RepID=A0A067T2U5_GALM3|nr:hypothetical protein GALMADRAFT_406137 [Galerina marginata CBS 339.88]
MFSLCSPCCCCSAGATSSFWLSSPFSQEEERRRRGISEGLLLETWSFHNHCHNLHSEYEIVALSVERHWPRRTYDTDLYRQSQ